MKFRSIMWKGITNRLSCRQYLIMCRQRLLEEVRWDDTVDRIFLQIKSDADAAETGMAQRCGIPKTNTGESFIAVIRNTSY